MGDSRRGFRTSHATVVLLDGSRGGLRTSRATGVLLDDSRGGLRTSHATCFARRLTHIPRYMPSATANITLAERMRVVFWPEFRRARAHVPRMVLFARDSQHGIIPAVQMISGFGRMLRIPMVFLGFQQERPDRNSARFLMENMFLGFLVEMLANTLCLQGFQHKNLKNQCFSTKKPAKILPARSR